MKDDSLRSTLIGAWSLVSYETKNAEGHADNPLGKDAQGIIMYTPDGYMSAQIMKADRPLFKNSDLNVATHDEFANAAASYLAYSGPFYVDEEKKSLRHAMTVSLFPNWLGQVQVRLVSLEDGLLHLGADGPILINGEMQDTFLVWKREPVNN
ncbi:MAG: lipocalin-like protein [Mucilaginibacter sp.]|nr:lipocalin-like protein [Mucilaginibacter sp.]